VVGEGVNAAGDPEAFLVRLPEVAPLDSDGDGIDDEGDNCADEPNPDQADLDEDGRGDVCDPDRDGDGVANGTDLCPETWDPEQRDGDADGLGDACDPDRDNDGVDDILDNCPVDPNPLQEDWDRDGFGDTCDIDADGDGVPNEGDQCPATPLTQLAHPKNGCSLAQHCPCGGPWRNHGQYVACMSHGARAFSRAGLLDGRIGKAAVREAVRSHCGKH
jgi:hypothetical protein